MAVLASCNKETQETPVPVPSEGDKVYTSFTAGGEDLTKVILNFADDKNIKWADTDEIAVFDGVGKNTFTIKEGTNEGATAVFEGAVDSGATTLYAVYPASAAGSLNGSSMSVTVPAAQVIGTGACADPAALVAVASAEKGSAMAFKQVCGLLMLSFTAEDIRTITISGQALAGTATVSADGTLGEVSEAANEITLTHADGLFPAGTYYVAVLPGTTPAGQFSISLSNGVKAGFKEGTKAVSFKRLKRLDAGSLDGLTMYTTISTMAELFDWNSTRVVAEESEPDNVMLVADIDMEEEPWVPKDFKGVFDGRGHKLYNLNVERTANACLFNTLTGTVKDLVVGSADGVNYDGVSHITQDDAEDTSGDWRYVALITRLSANAVLENVVNFAPVTVAETSVSKTRIGGLVAVAAGAASVKDCVNHGAVSNLATAPAAAGAVGGAIGWADDVLTMDSVTNDGAITVANAMTSYVGGILSCDNGGGSSLSKCYNKGSISITGTGVIGMCIGGILSSGIDSSLSNCENSGAISTVCDGELKVGGILGRASVGCTLKDCSNYSGGTITFNPATTSKQAFVGGIVGNAPGTNSGTLSIKSCKNYASLSSTHRNVATLGGIAGFLNMGSGVVVFEDCENSGNITRSSNDKGVNTNVSIGGIVANLAGGSTASRIENCTNSGNVSTSTNAASTTVRMGGVAGWLQSYTDVKDCTNEGNVRYEMADAKTVGSTVYVAGIVGHLVKGSSVSGCSNSGSIFANRKQVNRVGGIVGTVNSSAIYNSTNTGDVEVSVPLGTALAEWQAVGGIVGFAEGTTTGCTRAIEGCVNRGKVSALANTVPKYNRFAVGGIIGMPYDGSNIINNRNYGSVTGKNTNDTTPYSYVGGIIGQESAANTVSTISGNVNYGSVSNETAVASYCVAGGLFGEFGKAEEASGSNFGSVTASNAGAVAGINKSSITVTLCDAVTVNGVAKAAASDVNTWLCPDNTGTITPKYVAHSAEE